MLTKAACRQVNNLIEQLSLSHSKTLQSGEKIGGDELHCLAELINAVGPTVGAGIGVVGFLAGSDDEAGDDT
ncbi:hypothetical protein [Paenibacillus ferrarius]|uniref:hypothetical protein n=1 Tax=Paenibacillus ferrarius TaxID=1469647 RepID=UPI003D29ED3E